MPSKKFLNHNFNIDFKDLYAVEGLEKIHQKFLEFLKEKSPDHFSEYQIHNAENSQYLIEIAKILEIFLVELFLIHEKNAELQGQYLKYKKVCEARKDFIQRHVAKKYSSQDLELIKNFDHKKTLQNLEINFLEIDKIEIALSDKISAKENLEIIEKYCIWALFDEAGKKFHKRGALFILPQKTAIKNLITKEIIV
jgi:hypothetical protein